MNSVFFFKIKDFQVVFSCLSTYKFCLVYGFENLAFPLNDGFP